MAEREGGFTGFTFCAQYWRMERDASVAGIGEIFASLARLSQRPRYACLVLQLVSEIADGRGEAGPFVTQAGERILLRDWLCSQLMPISETGRRREALRQRVIAGLKDKLTGDPARDAARIEAAVEEQAQTVGRANISRAISDLVRAGFVTRHYAGYATNHDNRGGGRHSVYVVQPKVLQLLRGTPSKAATPGTRPGRQGELFAA